VETNHWLLESAVGHAILKRPWQGSAIYHWRIKYARDATPRPLFSKLKSRLNHPFMICTKSAIWPVFRKSRERKRGNHTQDGRPNGSPGCRLSILATLAWSLSLTPHYSFGLLRKPKSAPHSSSCMTWTWMGVPRVMAHRLASFLPQVSSDGWDWSILSNSVSKVTKSWQFCLGILQNPFDCLQKNYYWEASSISTYQHTTASGRQG